MTATRTAALAAASLLMLGGLAGCSDGNGSDGPKGSPAHTSTEPSDGLRTMAAWDEQEDGDAEIPVEPGDYVMPASGWSLTDFSVTFPDGWTVQYGHVFAKRTETGDEFGFYSVVVDDIFSDACSPEDESKRPVGPALDDLYGALSRQLSGAALSEPVRTTFGGLPATTFDMRVPDDLDLTTCRMGPTGLQIWYSAPADKYLVLLEGGTVSVYLVEVDGQRQLFVVQVDDSASAADRAELQAVLDSVQIEPASTEETATPQALVDDGSIYFSADPRGGDGLRAPLTFQQAEFHAKPRDIYLSRRGAPVRRVVAAEGADRCPRVSPDGDVLAYLHESTLVVTPLDAAGTPGPALLHTRLAGSPSVCPEWDPDGRRVGYVAFVGPETPLYTRRTGEVRAVTLDGQDRLIASFEAQVWHEPSFAWSPDGDAVAYTTESGLWRARPGGTPELLWRPAPGDPSEELPMTYDRPAALAWSSLGELAFTLYSSVPDQHPADPWGTAEERWTLQVVDPDSGRVAKLGRINGSAEVAWSPDGARLAFTRPRGQVVVRDADSGAVVDPTTSLPPGASIGEVAWSPDGDQLIGLTRHGQRGYALVSVEVVTSGTVERRTPTTWALDWVGVEDVDWSAR